MADGQLLEPVSLWQIRTRASLVECSLLAVHDLHYEVRVFQDRQLVIAERFNSEVTAHTYAGNLRQQLMKLSVDDDPESAVRRAG
ncbi:MAG TPA: hypothetical protein VK886_16365 [Vicinamibacterales bacterium]|nr:hypothetical protein [Vicinamibacterales bacterium]